jgi:hypothetical protein
MLLPSVEWIAPTLSIGRKVIGRASRHTGRLSPFVQAKELRICPNVRAILGDVQRKISHDPYSPFRRIPMKSIPFGSGTELEKGVKADGLA